jgi:hypothetical protein
MKKLVIGACFGLIGAATLLLTSCETESVSNNNLTVTPSSVGLRNGDTAVFTASGGFDYTWSLQTPSWGSLSAVTGPTTTYTDRYDPGSNGNVSAVQVLTLTSSIRGANSSGGGSSSNATTISTNADVLNTVTAQIDHLTTTTGTNSVITIDPSSATLHNSSTRDFTASGGSGTYAWALSSTAYGNIDPTTGSTVTYARSTDVASNVTAQILLYVLDSSNNYASATLSIVH